MYEINEDIFYAKWKIINKILNSFSQLFINFRFIISLIPNMLVQF